MNNNLLKARKKYANSAIFAVLTLIIGYTFLSTGNITVSEEEWYNFNMAFLNGHRLNGDDVHKFMLFYPGILLNAAAIVIAVKKIKIPTFLFLICPAFNFVMLLGQNSVIQQEYAMPYLKHDHYSRADQLGAFSLTEAHLTFWGYIFLLVCILWVISIIMDIKKSLTGTDTKIPVKESDYILLKKENEEE